MEASELVTNRMGLVEVGTAIAARLVLPFATSRPFRSSQYL